MSADRPTSRITDITAASLLRELVATREVDQGQPIARLLAGGGGA